MRPVLIVLAILGAAAMAYGAHRLLLWMEHRGWVYYRSKGTGSMGASAMFSLNEVFQPAARTAVVEREEQQVRGLRRPSPDEPQRPESSDAP